MKDLNSSSVVVGIRNCRQTILTPIDGRRLTRYLSFVIRHSSFYGSLVLLFCGFLLNACGTQLPLHRQMAPLPPGPICRVAVLPFLNDSAFPLADTMVSKVFATQFQASGNYLVIHEGDILKVYQQLHIMPGVALTPEQLRIIANRINAQLLITGIVMEMRQDRGEHGTVNPMLIMDIQILDGRSGETLWNAFHRRQGTDYKKTMHFGTINTATGLSRQMAEEIINLWFEKGLTQCDVSPQS